jgi:hypothetical protein
VQKIFWRKDTIDIEHFYYAVKVRNDLKNSNTTPSKGHG